MPPGQLLHEEAPVLLYDPAPHALHDDDPEPELNEPAAHGVQAAEPAALYVPAEHELQVDADEEL